MYNFSLMKQKVAEIEDWLKKEYFSVRTGRATPTVLDMVRVESYGAKVPVNQVGNITTEDARTLRIAPYDSSQIKEIEKAIVTVNLGLSVSSDEKGVRVFFPELTSETRASLLKVVREKAEQARVSLRAERDRVWADIQKKERNSEIGKDDKFRYKDEMQKIIDEGNTGIEKLTEKKEQEIKG